MIQYSTLKPSKTLETYTASESMIHTLTYASVTLPPVPSSIQPNPYFDAILLTQNEVVVSGTSPLVNFKSTGHTASSTALKSPSSTLLPLKSVNIKAIHSTEVISPTPSLETTPFEIGLNSDNWPFIAGLVVGAVLLVLIVIVSLLIIFVVSMRRDEEDSDKFSGDTESDTLFNVVAAAQQHIIEQRERPTLTCGEFLRPKSTHFLEDILE